MMMVAAPQGCFPSERVWLKILVKRAGLASNAHRTRR
jgi:hypothetical protein